MNDIISRETAETERQFMHLCLEGRYSEAEAKRKYSEWLKGATCSQSSENEEGSSQIRELLLRSMASESDEASAASEISHPIADSGASASSPCHVAAPAVTMKTMGDIRDLERLDRELAERRKRAEVALDADKGFVSENAMCTESAHAVNASDADLNNTDSGEMHSPQNNSGSPSRNEVISKAPTGPPRKRIELNLSNFDWEQATLNVSKERSVFEQYIRSMDAE